MKTHTKSTNFVAILIAVILFAIGFMLYFIHEQRQSSGPDKLGQTRAPSVITARHDLT